MATSVQPPISAVRCGGKYAILRNDEDCAINTEAHYTAAATVGRNVRNIFVTSAAGATDVALVIAHASSMPGAVIRAMMVVAGGGGGKFTLTDPNSTEVTSGRDLDAAGDEITIQSVQGVWEILSYVQA